MYLFKYFRRFNSDSVFVNFVIFSILMITVPLITFFVTYRYITPCTIILLIDFPSIEEKSRLPFCGIISIIICLIVMGAYVLLAFGEEEDLIEKKMRDAIDDNEDNENESDDDDNDNVNKLKAD